MLTTPYTYILILLALISLFFIAIVYFLNKKLNKINQKVNCINEQNSEGHKDIVREILERIDVIYVQNQKFQEASMITELIEKRCTEHLATFPTMPQELILACKRGIVAGGYFFKRGYLKKGYNRKHEKENLINLLKDIRASVTTENILLYDKTKTEYFQILLRNNLSVYTDQILDDIELFRQSYYNGTTFDKFIEMAVKCINNIISITANVYTQFNIK
jgi:hypothetical protein